MRYLPLEREHQQHKEVKDENRPEDGDVHSLTEGAQEGYEGPQRHPFPELHLWELPYKWPKFVLFVGWKDWVVVFFHVHIGQLGREEGYKGAKEVDSQGIANDMVAFTDIHPSDISRQHGNSKRPAEPRVHRHSVILGMKALPQSIATLCHAYIKL